MGIDIWEVIEAAKTKPFGFMPFYPGPGLGGHCIPIDPFYLTWKARELGYQHPLHRARRRDQHRHAALRRQTGCARSSTAASARGCAASHILVVGLAYKKNVDDMRESPALTIIGAAGADRRPRGLPRSVLPESSRPAGTRRPFAGRRSIAFEPSALAAISMRR